MLKKVGVIGGEEVAQKMDENEGKPSDGCYRGGVIGGECYGGDHCIRSASKYLTFDIGKCFTVHPCNNECVYNTFVNQYTQSCEV